MRRTYKIQPRPDNLEGGWNLKLYEANQEAGGGAYPVRREDPHVGMEWWNGLPETRRAHWLMMAASAMPTAARHTFLLVEAYNDAMSEGETWSTCPPMGTSSKRNDDNTTHLRRGQTPKTARRPLSSSKPLQDSRLVRLVHQL